MFVIIRDNLKGEIKIRLTYILCIFFDRFEKELNFKSEPSRKSTGFGLEHLLMAPHNYSIDKNPKGEQYI